MEPAAGIEPATDGLQNRCSTAELSWLKSNQTSGCKNNLSPERLKGKNPRISMPTASSIDLISMVFLTVIGGDVMIREIRFTESQHEFDHH